jgi:hypothetical protein
VNYVRVLDEQSIAEVLAEIGTRTVASSNST